MPKTPTELIEEIVRLLFENRAYDWSIEDKGVLVAAIKLQLAEKQERA